MDIEFTEEQQALRDAVRRFLADRSPEPEVRRVMATDEGYDPGVWTQLAQQLGLQGLAIPEEYGGAGSTWREVAVAMEEMGRALLPAPFLSTVALAAGALLASGDAEAAKQWLPGIAAGETVATLALTEPGGGWTEADVRVAAHRDGDAWRLDGVKTLVLDGHVADLLLVVARSDAGVGLFAVEGTADGLTRTPQKPMDPTRKLARVELADVAARLVGAEGGGWAAVDKALQLGAVMLAAEAAGGAQRTLEMAADYARTRVQFGRPIGGFQGVKHRCADMLLRTESLRSAAYYASWVAAQDRDDLPTVAHLAKAFCSEGYFQVAASNIQVHGGIGFTWEHPAHLYYKRAKSGEILFGSPSWHREQLARRLGV